MSSTTYQNTISSHLVIHVACACYAFLIALATAISVAVTLGLRNNEIGHVNDMLGSNLTVILSTNQLSQPSFAVAAGAILLSFANGKQYLDLVRGPTPLVQEMTLTGLACGIIISFAAGIPLMVAAVNGSFHVLAMKDGVVVDPIVFVEQAQVIGFSLKYWDRTYIRVMAIFTWPMILLSLIAFGFAVQRWRMDQRKLAAIHRREEEAVMKLRRHFGSSQRV